MNRLLTPLLAAIVVFTATTALADDQDMIKVEWGERIDAASFITKETVDLYVKQIDDAIARDQKKLATANPTEQERLRKRIQAMKKFKTWVLLPKNLAELTDLAKNAYSGLQEIDKEFAGIKQVMEKQTFWPLEIDLRKLGTWVKGADLTVKGVKLWDDLGKVDAVGYDERVGALVKYTKVLSAIGSQWGSKVPLIGDLLKGYADVTAEFVNAVDRLNGLLDKFDQGHIGWGSHGAGKAMNVAWNQQQISGTAQRVPGFKDLYQSIGGDGGLYLWDAVSFRTVESGGRKVQRKGRWWHLQQLMPGITLDDVRQRYLTLYRAGNRAPTAQDILHGYRKLIWVELAFSRPGMAPGTAFTITPRAHRIFDRREVKSAYGVLYDRGKPETRIPCRTGEAVSWTAAPGSGSHTLVFELAPESKPVWTLSGTATGNYFVGDSSLTKLSCARREYVVGDGRPLEMLLSVKLPDGSFADRGFCYLSAKPDQGAFAPRSVLRGSDLKEGNVALAWEPVGIVQPGKMTLEAKYEGIDDRVDKRFVAPSESAVEITVFQGVQTRIKGRKVRQGTSWLLKAQAVDERGQPVTHGELEFATATGRLQAGTKAGGGRVTVPATGGTVTWDSPPGRTETVAVTVRYKETRVPEKFVIYRAAETVVSLPPGKQKADKGLPPDSDPDTPDGDSGSTKDGSGPDAGKTDGSGKTTNPPPTVDLSLKFGVPIRRPPADADDAASRDDEPDVKLPDQVSGTPFDWSRNHNGGLPEAPCNPAREMGDEGRPPASDPQKPDIKLHDAPYMKATIPGGCKQKTKAWDNRKEITYYDGNGYRGMRVWIDGKLREVWPVINNNVHGGLVRHYTNKWGSFKQISYRNHGFPKAGRLYWDGVLRAEGVRLSDDPQSTLCRYTEFTPKGALRLIGIFDDFHAVEIHPPLLTEDDNFSERMKRAQGLVQWWWDDSPNMRFEGEFDGGNPRWVRVYYENGNVRRETVYDAQGDKHGTERVWLEGGEPLAEVPYRHGHEHGVAHYWGRPDTEGEFPGLLVREVEFLEGSRVRETFFHESDPEYGATHCAYRMTEFDVEQTGAGKPSDNPPKLRQITWFPDGSVYRYHTFRNDQRHGLWWEFHSNGRLATAIPYVDGVLHGQERHVAANGLNRLRRHFDKGNKQGPEVEYGASGRRVHSTNWHQGKKNGPERLWDDRTGRLVEETNWAANQKHGKHVLYSADTGRRTRLNTYQRGQQHGLEQHFTDAGDLIYECHWSNGQRHGHEKRWAWSTGILLQDHHWFKDQRDGEQLKYNWHGQVVWREKFKHGQRHGPQVHHEGTPRESVEYYLGGKKITSGRWQQYRKEIQASKRQ